MSMFVWAALGEEEPLMAVVDRLLGVVGHLRALI
jgi:hypothetical protein